METGSILDYTHEEARSFFLQGSQYSNLQLPSYFDFDNLISEVSDYLDSNLPTVSYKAAKKQESVNYKLLTNKDGRYNWRPVELLHPVLYVELVNIIAKKENWKALISKIAKLNKSAPNIESSAGWPKYVKPGVSQRAKQVSGWWTDVEQRSLTLGLEFSHLVKADIANCYGTIYTHSIPWAIHTKKKSKNNHDEKLFGNKIDNCIQAMQYGETKGIPQGSVLMDFLAELVLADIDAEIAAKAKDVGHYKILRYRDDYSIFVNDPLDGRKILKALSEVLANRGMHMNSDKSVVTDDIVSGALKPDKLDILNMPLFAVKMKSNDSSTMLTSANTFQKSMLQIYDFSRKHPNSGSLVGVLQEAREKLEIQNISKQSILPTTAILVNMLEKNPRLIPIIVPLIGDLTDNLPLKSKPSIIRQILKKLSLIPNTGHLDIFIQNMTYTTLREQSFDERLTEVVRKDSKQKNIWDNAWLNDKELRGKVEKISIIDRDVLNKTKWSMPAKETALFAKNYHDS